MPNIKDELSKMKFNEIAAFYKLAKKRKNSEKDYIAFQEFQAKKVIGEIKKYINPSGKLILDIGCGKGGYTKIFQDCGGRVVSLDSEMPAVMSAFEAFVQGDATKLPFKDDTFDLVFSSSLIEHLPKPQLLLNGVKHVMKKDAVFYLSFPPFYSPVGGHQFKPFNVFLPEKAATFFSRKLYGVRSCRYNDAYGKLYLMTIRKARKLIKQSGFSIIAIKTRLLNLNLAGIPFLNELLTWHVEFFLKK